MPVHDSLAAFRVQPPAAGRVPALDGLRCLAILLVFATHAASAVVPGGLIGVDVFFALSGYLITGLLLDEWARRGAIDLRRFYVRRARRLAPALLVAAVVLAPVALWLGYAHPVGDSVTAVLAVSNFYSAWVGVERGTIGHSWSLSVEQQFYLVWAPAVLALVALRRHAVLPVVTAVAVVACLAGTSAALHLGAPLSVLYLLPTTRLPELLIGGLVAMAHRSSARPALHRVASRPVVASATLAALLLVAFLDVYDEPFMYQGGFALVAVATSVLILHFEVNQASWLTRLFSMRVAVWFGVVSYSFYLWHYSAVVVVKQFLPVAPAIVVAFGVATGLAALSHRFIEVPFTRRTRSARARGVTAHVGTG